MRHATIAIGCLSGVGLIACGPSDGAVVDRVSRGTQCGPTLDFIPVNAYTGELFWVDRAEEAVAIVNGNCTGTLIETDIPGASYVLTAGHCGALSDEVQVVFNHEDDADGPVVITGGFVVERSDEPDYALVELIEDPGLPRTQLGLRFTNHLAIIQHPRGLPKVIATGFFAGRTGDEVQYADLDTLVGSSGAGILNGNGRLAGVHTGGDCTEGGVNEGWSVEAIVEASDILDVALLDGC